MVAIIADRYLRKRQENIKNRDLKITVPRDERTSKIGNLSYKALPLIIIVLWIFIIDSYIYVVLPSSVMLYLKFVILAIPFMFFILYARTELKEFVQLIFLKKLN